MSKFTLILNHVSSQFVGREEAVRALLTTTVAQSNAVLLGPPGTAKSALVGALTQSLPGKGFETLLTRETPSTALFGDLDLASLRMGVRRQDIRGYISEATWALLDECFKGGSHLLNALLRVANEREARFEGESTFTKLPLKVIFGMSNEPPEGIGGRRAGSVDMAALWDRFAVRLFLSPDFSHTARSAVRKSQFVRAAVGPAPVLTMDEWVAASAEAKRIDEGVSATYEAALFDLIDAFRGAGKALSPRKENLIFTLAAAHAVVCGRAALSPADVKAVARWALPESEADLPLIDKLLANFGTDGDRRVAEARESLQKLAVDLERRVDNEYADLGGNPRQWFTTVLREPVSRLVSDLGASLGKGSVPPLEDDALTNFKGEANVLLQRLGDRAKAAIAADVERVAKQQAALDGDAPL